MISRNEITRGQDVPLELEANLQALLAALNLFRGVWGNPMIVTSGYRSAEHNAAVGGRAGSAHLTCQAADIADPSGSLKAFCYSNTQLLEDCGLWIEDPSHTPQWLHFQIRPASKRIFIP